MGRKEQVAAEPKVGDYRTIARNVRHGLWTWSAERFTLQNDRTFGSYSSWQQIADGYAATKTDARQLAQMQCDLYQQIVPFEPVTSEILPYVVPT